MAYERVNWLNKGETGAKAINKGNLNIMDKGIADLDTAVGNTTNLNTNSKEVVGAINEVYSRKPIIAQNRVDSVDYAPLKSGDYVPFTKEDFNNSNGKIVFNSNGTITINHTGIIKINVLLWINGSSNLRPWVKIMNLTKDTYISGQIDDIGTSEYLTITIPNIYVRVESGDNLGVRVTLMSSGAISINKNSGAYNSYMNIEIIE